MTQSLPKATTDQERWGAAATLLSLDVVTPFYRHMGLTFADPDTFLWVLRESIVNNRRTFEGDPSQVPDLKGALLDALRHAFGSKLPATMLDWVANVFVFSGGDFTRFSKWYMLLALARTDPNRWRALGFREALEGVARVRLEQVLDRSELHSLADKIDQAPLSDWDLEMYSLHGFDDDNDPYNWVLETVKKRRFLEYLRWLVRMLSSGELDELVDHANELRKTIASTRKFPPLVNPERLLKQA